MEESRFSLFSMRKQTPYGTLINKISDNKTGDKEFLTELKKYDCKPIVHYHEDFLFRACVLNNFPESMKYLLKIGSNPYVKSGSASKTVFLNKNVPMIRVLMNDKNFCISNLLKFCPEDTALILSSYFEILRDWWLMIAQVISIKIEDTGFGSFFRKIIYSVYLGTVTN